ncbi:DUF5304 domain-containing protein [Streptomyces sp. SL13]|uniref:DUF5304 domain-containing protein n=1 Tax=Streptantibioticus silvisoli TaxID=2705255 RepID=A0AA90H941_9ACTN|nr:DUF5304 domain-containing protein [Streptantibioticus silvisoli]MDI5963540.1 DUF5304 domain-containing protein [Streptantibioticus silvisoli]MDI5970207.1 DUF5304 domain-containing protein [Streptantibioticus silvisoli]
MSESLNRPQTDDDAWATACAEDLAGEKARRREQSGTTPGSAADELRKLADAVVDKLAELRTPAAELAARAVFSQVKAAGNQLKDRNPGVFDHLAAAGGELLSAYRAAVTGQEQRWTRSTGSGDPFTKPAPTGSTAAGDTGSDGEEGDGPAGPERIDLD